MDHSHDMTPVDGPWAGGWAIAALAGLFAVAVAKGLGDVRHGPGGAGGCYDLSGARGFAGVGRG